MRHRRSFFLDERSDNEFPFYIMDVCLLCFFTFGFTDVHCLCVRAGEIESDLQETVTIEGLYRCVPVTVPPFRVQSLSSIILE